MKKLGKYTVRNKEPSDINDCERLLGSVGVSSNDISSSDGVVLEYDNNIVGFATYEIEDGIVSFPVGFIKSYVVDVKHRGTKGSLALAIELIVEKMRGHSIYTSSANADSFRGMVNERPISGRTNKIFKIYRVKTNVVKRLYELRKTLTWEVNTAQ